ncbi:MAG: hypothetical protein AAFX06_31560, partial [Planctomycetota bacterium]
MRDSEKLQETDPRAYLEGLLRTTFFLLLALCIALSTILVSRPDATATERKLKSLSFLGTRCKPDTLEHVRNDALARLFVHHHQDFIRHLTSTLGCSVATGKVDHLKFFRVIDDQPHAKLSPGDSLKETETNINKIIHASLAYGLTPSYLSKSAVGSQRDFAPTVVLNGQKLSESELDKITKNINTAAVTRINHQIDQPRPAEYSPLSTTSFVGLAGYSQLDFHIDLKSEASTTQVIVVFPLVHWYDFLYAADDSPYQSPFDSFFGAWGYEYSRYLPRRTDDSSLSMFQLSSIGLGSSDELLSASELATKIAKEDQISKDFEFRGARIPFEHIAAAGAVLLFFLYLRNYAHLKHARLNFQLPRRADQYRGSFLAFHSNLVSINLRNLIELSLPTVLLVTLLVQQWTHADIDEPHIRVANG